MRHVFVVLIDYFSLVSFIMHLCHVIMELYIWYMGYGYAFFFTGYKTVETGPRKCDICSTYIVYVRSMYDCNDPSICIVHFAAMLRGPIVGYLPPFLYPAHSSL